MQNNNIMKKLLLLLPFLFLNPVLQAQMKETPNNGYKNSSQKIFNEYKSTFEKPEYHYITLPFVPNNYFHPISLNEEKTNALLDTLKSNTVLKMVCNENGKRLRLCVTFPKMGSKYFSTIEEAKLSILETHIYTPDNKEVEFIGARNYEYNHIDTEKQHERIVSFRQTLNKEMALSDTTLNISRFHGKAHYKLSFVVGYDSLRLDSSSISKIFRFGDADIKVIDIIENKVIIQVINSKTGLTHQHISLLNFDSIGYLRRSDYRYLSQQSAINAQARLIDKGSQKSLFTGMYSMQQSVYEAFKKNPEISSEDLNKASSLQPKEKKYITYLVYCSYAPLKNSFLLYKPIFGNDHTMEVELSN
jgi:hypothetical protein